MSEKLHSYVYSSEVLEFVKQCKHYTDLLESDLLEDRKTLVISLLKTLPGLYNNMINIGIQEPIFDAENEKFVTEEKWSEIYQKLAGILGSQNEYLDVPEDEEYDRLEVISRELSEDLSDIYQDIKDFTEAFRVGTEEVMNDVLWECRVNFESFWGAKVLRASQYLHKIMLRDDDVLEKMDKDFEEKYSTREIRADEWQITKRQKETGKEGDI